MSLLKIFYYYFKAVLCYRLRFSNNKNFYLAGKFLHKSTFRLPEATKKDPYFFIRIYYKCLKAVFSSRKAAEIKQADPLSNSIIYDNSLYFAERRLNYVEHFSKEKIGFIAGRDRLFGTHLSFLSKISLIILLLLLFPLFLLLSFSPAKKYYYPFMIREALEVYALLNICSQHQVKKIHHFCIYERDSNVNALLLMDAGIYLNKIPADLPLTMYNPIIISNSISCCFHYQKDEIGFFSESMVYDQLAFWGPENSLLYRHLYEKEEFQSTYPIGYYSSASWLRVKLGRVDLGFSLDQGEDMVLNMLDKYIISNGKSLQLYLHPLEKKPEHLQLSKEYYSKKLKCNFTIADTAVPGTNSFDQIEVGISLFSTILFERVYCGFKTIIVPLNIPDFPVEGSSLSNICVKDESELIAKLDQALTLTRKEYFQQNELLNYAFNMEN